MNKEVMTEEEINHEREKIHIHLKEHGVIGYKVIENAQPIFDTTEAYNEWVESFKACMSDHYNSK